MDTVFVIADFSGAAKKYERGGLKKYNQARHDKAVENNPFHDFEKQLKSKKMAPDFVQRNVNRSQVDSGSKPMPRRTKEISSPLKICHGRKISETIAKPKQQDQWLKGKG